MDFISLCLRDTACLVAARVSARLCCKKNLTSCEIATHWRAFELKRSCYQLSVGVYLDSVSLCDLLQKDIVDGKVSRVLPAGGAAQLLRDSLPQKLRLLDCQRRRLQNLFTLWESELLLNKFHFRRTASTWRPTVILQPNAATKVLHRCLFKIKVAKALLKKASSYVHFPNRKLCSQSWIVSRIFSTTMEDRAFSYQAPPI